MVRIENKLENERSKLCNLENRLLDIKEKITLSKNKIADYEKQLQEHEVNETIIALESSGISLKALREAAKKGDFAELNELLDLSR